MYISNLQLGNFKRFESTNLDLSSKITVLVGPNSSGKSSLLKALLAMKQTASPSNENEVFATQGEYVDLGVYRDYVYNHEVDRKVVVGLSFASGSFLPALAVDNDSVIFKVTLGHDHVTEQARLMEIRLSDLNTGAEIFSIIKKITRDSFTINVRPAIAEKFLRGSIPGNERDSLVAGWKKGISLRVDDKYQMRPGSAAGPVAAGFGLKDYPIVVARNTIDSIFRSLDRSIFYIGPIRRSPSRSYARTGHLLSVGPAGEHTTSVLANLKARAAKERAAKPIQKERLQELQTWVSAIFPDKSVDATRVDELVKLMVRRGPRLGETISDVGFGISQALPILVQAAVMPNDSTLIIEQPELHLHPSAQTKLSEFIAEASKSGRRFIVETHSEHFVRGLQLAISNDRAKKRRAPRLTVKDVKFFYVPAAPAEPTEMKVNEWGEFVTEWPKGFFDEAYRLAMHLLENKMRTIASESGVDAGEESK